MAYNLAVIYVMKFRLRLCAAGGGLVKEADMADIIFFDSNLMECETNNGTSIYLQVFNS